MGTARAGTLAEDLRKAITDSGKTIYAISKECGVGHGILDRFIKGERDIRVATASKICEVIGYGLAKIDQTIDKLKPARKPAKKASKKKPPT